MKLVREIRDEVVDTKTSLSATLRKAKILAASLANNEFRTWVDSELNGYSGNKELPEYRQLNSPVLGNFSGPFGKSVTGYQLPVALMPDHFKDMARAVPLGHPIKVVETYAATAKEELRCPWPTDAVLLLRDKVRLSGGFEVIEIYQPISKAQLDGILDAVRNRLLNFILALQDIDPNVLDSEESLGGIPKEAVSHIFNVTIYGDHNVLASGDRVTQHVSQNVPANDKKALLAYLKQLGLEEDDLVALDDAIKADEVREERSIGTRVREWLGRVTAKAVDGTWKTVTSAAPTLLTKALSKYYGWD